MRLDRKMQNLIDEHGFASILHSIIGNAPLEKMLLELSNQCVFKSNAVSNKKTKRNWYNAARSLHRAYDEVNTEKTRKAAFKVVRRDYYLCPKCKKKFRVDPMKEENCKFEVDRGVVVVKCPNCEFSE